ncbi:F-box/LRR-repeat protein fbxl-1-like [Schistocerca americana]|uniref:F-box/LRR-repeat protein fbxl-1-like n=1 Tax=Schistocerca americana TaxID=7009 RepID=UPI001F4F3D76|nr:F-box/LRR-repeat protein fbxl-1-like [Schistocerca americana]
MASQPEHSGGCHTASEDVKVCRSSAPPELPPPIASSASQNVGHTHSHSDVSDTNLNTQQLEIAVSDAADGTVRDTWCPSIDDLPDEILIKIFSYMSFSELVDVVQKVCSRWRRLSQDLELWADKEYHIRDSSAIDSDSCKGGTTDREAIQTFCDTPNLRIVCMRRGATSRVFRALYNNCQKLSELQMHVTQKLSYSVLKNLVEKCSRIHTLRIPSELLKSEKFSEAVSHLQHLRVLNVVLRFTKSTPVLRPLGDGCPQLAEVDLRSTVVDMDDLRCFLNAKRNTLKSIRIKWTMAGKKCVLPLLTVCADSLECLQLYGYDIVRDDAREAFTALGRLKNLKVLKMAIIKPAPPGTAALAFMDGGLPKLRLLDLRGGYGLDDDTVIAISRGCPALRELIVRGCHLLSDAAFSQIYHLEQLEILDVSRCRGLDGALVPYLAGLPRLHTLLMENMDFPKLQPGLSSILEMSSLRCLKLDHSLVTGVPFDKFPGKLFGLRDLSIAWCRGDLKATDGLAERMPNLEIHGKAEVEEPTIGTEEHESGAAVWRLTKMVIVTIAVTLIVTVITLCGMKVVNLLSS